ncbi:CAP family protein [Kitasatospora sp. NPDC056327]|uniref:CAP family protein n=1 Tax=Kitasatospora sp. NPDC056327 TaxID=3345785 RepID=UPI0035DA9649
MNRTRIGARTLTPLLLAAALAASGTTPAAARTPLPDATDAAFTEDCLQAHNQYRARHGAPALVTDPAAQEYARSRAAVVSASEGLSAGHGGLDPGYGENQYWHGSDGPARATCRQAVDTWYAQGRAYDFTRPGYSPGTGLFTQVVWRSTTRLGCARSHGRGSAWYETYVICSYGPPGNVLSQFPENVLPPRP